LLRFEQPDGRTLRAQHAARGLADLREHCRQVERRGQLARDLEDLQQRFGTQADAHGLDLRRHRLSPPAVNSFPERSLP
jgi:hypothetical protein